LLEFPNPASASQHAPPGEVGTATVEKAQRTSCDIFRAGEEAAMPRANPVDRLPPFDEAAEAGALGCVLLADGDAPRLLEELDAADFYDQRHRAIYAALRRLRADGQPLSAIALIQLLRDRGQLADAGGFEYVAGLPDAAPSPAAWPTFYDTLRDRATRRCALRDAAELSRLALDTSLPAAAIADAARRLLDLQASNRRDALPPIQDARELIATPAPTPPELVWGILHQGSKLVLGGGSKTFKTWTLLDLAVSVAAGEPWLSFKTTKGRVLFLNFEIAPAFFRQRIQAVLEAKHITLAPHALDVWNLRGRGCCYTELLPMVRQRARGAGYSLIVLDPVYKLYGATDENSAGDVAGLMNGLELVTVDTGASVGFGAHYAKGNAAAKEAIDRISGSGVFARDPDTILNFTRHEEENAFTVEATLRNHPPIVPFVARWQYPLMRRDNQLDPARLKQAGGRKPLYSTDDLLAILPATGLSNSDWLARAASEGMSKATFFRLRKELETGRKILQSAMSAKWQPIPAR